MRLLHIRLTTHPRNTLQPLTTMAAIPATPSRFGSSFSGALQAPYNTDAPSMADSLPSVDFGFNDLRERMTAFTHRFDDFIERGRKRVLEERNAFRMNVAELEETQRTRRLAILSLESQSSSHAETLEKESAETSEMHAAISALQAQKQDHVARRTQLQHEIAATQTQIRQRREAQAAHQRALDAQARHNLPELRFWETCLGLRIEGAGADDGGERLRFCFEGLSGREDGKDAWFEIDTGARDFEVVGTRPRLEAEEVEAVVERANETKELNGLLKGMRGLLIEALRG